MFRRYYSLVMMAIWLAAAAVLLVPGWEWAENVRRGMKLGEPQGTLLGVLALLFAGYNAARWWQIQTIYRLRADTRPPPFQVRKVPEEEKYVPNPELDFFKPAEPEKPPEPSPNGEHKAE
jgi:hypothetical protein